MSKGGWVTVFESAGAASGHQSPERPARRADAKEDFMMYETCDINQPADSGDCAQAWFILSAMETADAGAVDRRLAGRLSYRVEALLALAIDRPGDDPRRIYTRDISPHGI